MFDRLPLHLRARVAAFLAAGSLKHLLCTGRATRLAFAQPVVLRACRYRCQSCGARFCGASGSCCSHPGQLAPESGLKSALWSCCGRRESLPQLSALPRVAAESEGCVSGPHHAQGRRPTLHPQPGDEVEVFRASGEWEPGEVASVSVSGSTSSVAPSRFRVATRSGELVLVKVPWRIRWPSALLRASVPAPTPLRLLKTHLCAVVGSFLPADSLRALAVACDSFSHPAVMREAQHRCTACGVHFRAADNGPEACTSHSGPLQDHHSSQGEESYAMWWPCCRARSRTAAGVAVEDVQRAVRAMPGCVRGPHHAAPVGRGDPKVGDEVELALFPLRPRTPGSWMVNPKPFQVRSERPVWERGTVMLREKNERRLFNPNGEGFKYSVRTEGGISAGLEAWRVRWPSVA